MILWVPVQHWVYSLGADENVGVHMAEQSAHVKSQETEQDKKGL